MQIPLLKELSDYHNGYPMIQLVRLYSFRIVHIENPNTEDVYDVAEGNAIGNLLVCILFY